MRKRFWSNTSRNKVSSTVYPSTQATTYTMNLQFWLGEENADLRWVGQQIFTQHQLLKLLINSLYQSSNF